MIEFFQENWAVISEIVGAILAIGWVVVRLMPTGKNKDLIEGVLTILGKLVPNRSHEEDEDGSLMSHVERKVNKRKETRRAKRNNGKGA